MKTIILVILVLLPSLAVAKVNTVDGVFYFKTEKSRTDFMSTFLNKTKEEISIKSINKNSSDKNRGVDISTVNFISAKNMTSFSIIFPITADGITKYDALWKTLNDTLKTDDVLKESYIRKYENPHDEGKQIETIEEVIK
jgi:hypothetical protein